MKQKCWMLLGIVTLCVSSLPADEEASATLFWGNGDSLPGTLVSAEGDTLVWNAPALFAEPLELNLNVLSSVRFPESGDAGDAFADEFRITMADNNVLSGSISAVSGDTITFQSQRHGRLVLLKDQILNLQRRQEKGLVFLGPRGIEGWKARGTGAKLSDWKEENDGSLTTLTGETGIYRPMDFPERCEVEVVLTSSRMPDFILSLGSSEKGNPRVEMWGDELICRCGLDFVELKTVRPDERKLHFHVFADFRKQVMAVYSNTGRLLGQTSTPGARRWAKPTLGLVVEAVDGDLTVKSLRVSEWDGRLPRNLTPGQTRVQTRNGDIHYGTISGYSPESEKLSVKLNDVSETLPDGAGRMMEFPVEELTNLVLSTAEQQANDAGKTMVSWKNGGFVSGKLVSLTSKAAIIQTSYSVEPVKCSLLGLRTIRLPNSESASEEPDRLFFDGGTLRGNLTVEDHETAPIRWRPVGGRNSTTLVSRGKARFQRGREASRLLIDTGAFPDVIFLKGGDVIPCRVESCDKEHVRLSSPVADVRQLRNENIKALELGSVSRERQAGFGADGWKKINGAATAAEEKLTFRSAGGFGNAHILTGNSLSFRLRWTSRTYGTMTTWLYAEKLTSPEHATPVTFTFSPTQLSVTDQAPDQNQGMVFFGGGNMGEPSGIVKTPTRDAEVEMVARDGKVSITINGEKLKTFPMRSGSPGARGLLFSSSITLVNVRNSVQPKDDAKLQPLEISEFAVRNISGTSAAQFINEEARSRTLTVPRFRRDDPPTHVVLAPNGDLLRGRLNAVTDTHVHFESRLEEFRFPRERVAAVIWLADPESESDLPDRPETAVQAQLDNGYTITITPQRMKDGRLIGSSNLLGNCQIPALSIRDLFLGSPDGRDEILSYVSWIPTQAPEPAWDTTDDATSDEQSPLIGTVAEDFELETLSGEKFRLSDHQDKVVILDFWATWCGPCVVALPQYIEATSRFDESEAIFVAVNLEESKDRIRAFLDRQNLAPTVALDRGSVIARRFGVSGIPHSVVLGKGNVIRHVTVGLQDGLKEKTQAHIDALLNPVSAGAAPETSGE